MGQMLHAIGQLCLAAVLIVVFGAILARVASAAFGPASSSPRAARGGGRTALRSQGTRAVRSAGRSAIAAAAHPGNRQIRAQARADVRRAWETARSTDWLEQRRHDRANGTGGPATATAPPRTLRQRLLAPFTPQSPDPASGGSNGNGHANGSGSTPAPQPAQGGTGGSPARPVPPPPVPAPPASTNGGTPVSRTSSAAAEKMIEGIQEIYEHAARGGLNAKQEAIRAAHEGASRFAGMMQMLARTMSEPDHRYGPEITEPIGKAGEHFQAGAQSLSEADAALETLANMTLREASQSRRQVPHHEHELSENGRH